MVGSAVVGSAVVGAAVVGSAVVGAQVVGALRSLVSSLVPQLELLLELASTIPQKDQGILEFECHFHLAVLHQHRNRGTIPGKQAVQHGSGCKGN